MYVQNEQSFFFPLILSTAAACNIIWGDSFKKIQGIEIINVLFTENQTDQKY